MYLTELTFYTQYIANSHVFYLVHATTVMYLTVFLSFNISHLTAVILLTKTYLFIHTPVYLFSVIYLTALTTSVMYWTIFSFHLIII